MEKMEKKRFRCNLGFSRHFQFLRLAALFNFFPAQNLSENVYIISTTFLMLLWLV
jgi:hypothetical protein